MHLLACRRHFKNKKNIAPQGHNLESDQANLIDDADRGTCDLAVFCFRYDFVPWGREGDLWSCTTYRRHRREICFFPFTACFRGPKWPGCERQEVAPQAGGKMRPYVAVGSSCCLLYLLLQRGSQGGRARGVAAAVAALPFLLSCASDLPRCLMSHVSVHVFGPSPGSRSISGRCAGAVWPMSKDPKYKAVKKNENEADLNRSATAKPAASAGLKNRLFSFDVIRYGLQAPAGRRHRRTTSWD